jgi:hypothetical protein
MKLPKLYTTRDLRPCHNVGHCLRCGRKLDAKVQLELDQRTNEYHDFGGVPANCSQGWFDFGPDCAEALRTRARAATMQP